MKRQEHGVFCNMGLDLLRALNRDISAKITIVLRSERAMGLSKCGRKGGEFQAERTSCVQN